MAIDRHGRRQEYHMRSKLVIHYPHQLATVDCSSYM